MTIRTHPATSEYREGWDAIFAREESKRPKISDPGNLLTPYRDIRDEVESLGFDTSTLFTEGKLSE